MKDKENIPVPPEPDSPDGNIEENIQNITDETTVSVSAPDTEKTESAESASDTASTAPYIIRISDHTADDNSKNKAEKNSRNSQSKISNPVLRILKKKYVMIPLAVIVALVIAYCLFAFAGFKPFSTWRRVYIETAMSTGDHQWLATRLLPQWVIDREYTPPEQNADVVGGNSFLLSNEEYEKQNQTADSGSADASGDISGLFPDHIIGKPYEPSTPSTSGNTQTPARPSRPTTPTTPKPSTEVTDILGQKELKVGEPDKAGNKVVINDIEQGIVVSEIERRGDFGTYRGKVMLIDDPSRVYVGTTPYKNREGLRIKAMMEYHGAIAGINASGFNDPNDSGHGGDVIGLTCSRGEFWGEPVTYYGSVLITKNDRLVVGNVTNWQNYAIREGIQFGPVLIADGVGQYNSINYTGGFGYHPRTAIGQREDGVIVFLVIDGRSLSSSGCTMKDLIDILTEYDVINAACCDGGSSSIMAYNGEVITKNSSANPDYGRRLPNAWLVRPKESSND